MPGFYFPFVEGVDVKDSMEASWVSSLDAIETLIESNVDEVDPFVPYDEEVGSPLNGREKSFHSKEIDSEESRNLLKGKIRK